MNILDLELQAEREKLGRLLGVDESELSGYNALGLDGMRAVAIAINTRIFDRGAKQFAGLAKSSGLLPGKISGLIAQKALGARLAAQVTGLLEPAQAVKLAAYISVQFQADLCTFLDPRRAGPVLRAMPLPIVLETSRELVRREEYMTMARFVEDLRQEQIDAVSEILAPVAMLWIGFYVESGERLSQLIAGLDDRRLFATSEAAAEQHLWPQALAMMARVDDATLNRMIALLVDGGEDINRSVLNACAELDLWDVQVEIMRRIEPALLQRQEHLMASVVPEAVAELRRRLGEDGSTAR